MEWFVDHYLGPEGDRKDPLVSPVYADAGELADLPPALIITAEYDPLRDEGEAYGLRLEEAGVPVTISRYEGQIHGFFSMGAMVDAGRRAVDDVATGLRTALRHEG
jgi:acetyl esterase